MNYETYEDQKENVLSITPLLNDNAVIQRNKPITIWGKGVPGSKVSGSFHDIEFTASVDSSGSWQASIGVFPAGGPYTLTVTDGDTTVYRNNVMVGDVWILAGQSNMELWLGRVTQKYPTVLNEAHDGNIRVFAVPQQQNFIQEQTSISDSSWIVVGEDDISGVSAVGYFFAQIIREHTHIPIGLISTAIGGSHIEAWMDRESLNRLGLLPDNFERLTQEGYVELQQERYAAYESDYNRTLDTLDKGLHEQWQNPAYDDSSWDIYDPSYYNDPVLRGSGSVWLRLHCQIPESYVGTSAEVHLGTMLDADECFANGVSIGHTDYRYPPRIYSIAQLPEELTLTIRLRVFGGNGQLTMDKPHEIVLHDGRRLDLNTAAEWRVARGCGMPNRQDPEFYSHMAVGNYNAMIAPLRHVESSGVLWYQGESNADANATVYGKLLCALVQCWRRTFADPELPWFVAQLPNYSEAPNCDWPRLRNEQLRVLDLDHTALIVTADLGEDNDLHPINKKGVAQRFAQAALAMVYGEDREPMGPIPVCAKRLDDGVEIRFIHTGRGMHADRPLSFEILEPGGRAISCEVEPEAVRSQRLVVPLSQEIGLQRGSVIRYDWVPSPQVILRNDADLPAAPFELIIGM